MVNLVRARVTLIHVDRVELVIMYAITCNTYVVLQDHLCACSGLFSVGIDTRKYDC